MKSTAPTYTILSPYTSCHAPLTMLHTPPINRPPPFPCTSHSCTPQVTASTFSLPTVVRSWPSYQPSSTCLRRWRPPPPTPSWATLGFSATWTMTRFSPLPRTSPPHHLVMQTKQLGLTPAKSQKLLDRTSATRLLAQPLDFSDIHNLTEVFRVTASGHKVSLIIIFIIAVLFLVAQSSAAIHGSENNIMKVHPVPWKRNISIQFGVDGENPMSEAQALLGIANKKLYRLPHVFSCVLELLLRRRGGGGGPWLLPLHDGDRWYRRL